MASKETCPICKLPSILRCGGCKEVVYCSKDHQVKHWKIGHKNFCKSYEVMKNASLGRYVVATRDIKVGELIFREEPLVMGPKTASMPICLGCHRMLTEPVLPKHNFYKCSKCQYPLCGPKCEVSQFHLDECKLMSLRNFKVKIDYKQENYSVFKKESAYCAILPIRCMLLKDTDPKKYEELMRLEHHLEQRLNTPLYKILCPNLLTFIRSVLRLSQWTETDIMRIAAILDTNSFEVRQKNEGRKIRALYPVAAMLSHSCAPNARHVFDDNMCINIYAKQPIIKGEIICISYTQPLWSTLKRRIHLEQTKCFKCQCERCADPTEFDTFLGSITCQHCKIGKIISNDPLDNDANWRCQICSHEINARKVAAGNAALEAELSKLDKHSALQFENYIHQYQETVHGTNTHVVQAKYALSQLYAVSPEFPLFDTDMDVLNRKTQVCRDLLRVADLLDSGWSIFRGNILLELQDSLALIAKNEFKAGKFNTSEYQAQLREPIEFMREAYNILKLEPGQEPLLKKRLCALLMEASIKDDVCS